MKARIWIVVLILALGALVGWRFAANKRQQATQQTQGGPGGGGGRRQTPTVELAVAKPAVIESRLESVGTAESPLRIELSPRVSGRIQSLTVREGDPVKPGQALVVLDPAELEQRVAERQAAVAEARSRLAQAQLQAGPNEAAVRGDILQARAALSSAQANLRQLQQNYDAQVAAADAAVTDQRGRVDSAEAQVRNAQAALAREQAALTNLETRYNRLNTLLQKGYVAGQEVDDARTAADVQRKQVDVAESQLAAARSAVISAQANLNAARNQAAIVRRKGSADIKAGQAQVAQAQSALSVATANRASTPAYQENIQALRANVTAAQAQLDQARTQLGEAVLRSTVDGVVTARNADPGALASPGQPVLVVQTIDWLYVVTSIPLEESGKVRVGQTANITFDGLPGRTFTGTVSNINPAANVQSRQVQVRIRLANPDRSIKPGMYGKVGFLTRRVEAPVAVPQEAVKRSSEGETTVAVVDAENKARVRPVRLGASDGKVVQILSGVSAGERVVTLSFQPVRDDQEVRTAEEEGQGGGRRGGGGQRGAGRSDSPQRGNGQ